MRGITKFKTSFLQSFSLRAGNARWGMTSYSLPPGLLSAPPAIVASGGFVRLPSPFDPSTSSHNPPGDSDCGSRFVTVALFCQEKSFESITR